MTPSGIASILVVEDNDDNREAAEWVLTTSGYHVTTVADAYGALEFLRAGGRVSVIVLDLHLPGMDGRQFLSVVKQDAALAGIPIVVFSGDPDGVGDVDAFVRKGQDDPDVLLDAIAACLRSRAA
jgi:chemotaxis family two-component system response regulator Rcp1